MIDWYEEKRMAKEKQNKAWGSSWHGLVKQTDDPRRISVTVTIPEGACYIRGREVIMKDEVTLLGREYFLPAGADSCPGRILS